MVTKTDQWILLRKRWVWNRCSAKLIYKFARIQRIGDSVVGAEQQGKEVGREATGRVQRMEGNILMRGQSPHELGHLEMDFIVSKESSSGSFGLWLV